MPNRINSLFLSLLFILLFTLYLPTSVHAANYTVNSTDDLIDTNPGNGICASSTNVCTLRAAIMEANANSDSSNTISLPVGHYLLSKTGQNEDAAVTGDLDISKNLTILGSGATEDLSQADWFPTDFSNITVVDANYDDRVFDIKTGVTVSISNMDIVNGGLSSGSAGGGIRNIGNLTLNHILFSGNQVYSNSNQQGGAIYNSGNLTFSHGTMDSNILGFSGSAHGKGGGLYNAGSATLTNIRITSNFACSSCTDGYGGGIYNAGTLSGTNLSLFNNYGNYGGLSSGYGGGIANSGTMTLSNSVFLSNFGINGVNNSSAVSEGGGLYNTNNVSLTNVTISKNYASNSQSGGSSSGSGIYNDGQISIINTTINNNFPNNESPAVSGLGIVNTVGKTAELTNTIVGDDCIGTITSHGHNIDAGSSCGFSNNGDLLNTNPDLTQLSGNQYGDNPSNYFIYKLNEGSPAIDAGTNLGCPTTDQRGLPRPEDGDGNGSAICDIGSYEVQPEHTLVTAINSGGDATGNFVADTNSTGGQTYSSTNPVDTSTSTVSAPEAVYKSVRYGNFTYTIPNLTANANYTVRLHFNELYWGIGGNGGVGSRVFNVSANGNQVLSNYDILADTGGPNIVAVKQIPVTANSSGNITLDFSTVTDNAMVNGIEVYTGTLSTPPAPSQITSIAINSGGTAVGSFLDDIHFSGGQPYSSSASVDTSGVTSPAPQGVYQTSRYGNMTYTLTNLAPSSSYTVNLHFNELYWGTSLSGGAGGTGSRLFNVTINGTQELNNFDIYSTAGGSNKAIVEPFTVNSDSHGIIKIDFTTVTDQALINGIEISHN